MNQKQTGEMFELFGKWMQLLGKGIASKKGLNNKDKLLFHKYTNQIESKQQNLREDKQ